MTFHRDEANDGLDEAVDSYKCDSCSAEFSIGWVMLPDDVNPSEGFKNLRYVPVEYCPYCGCKGSKI